MQKSAQANRKPFFVRFLEDQELSPAQGGRPPYHTLKYPSDDDEDSGIEL